jgi:acyl-CoA reductase-like NAD-dependent aldehyde dehydrogenase
VSAVADEYRMFVAGRWTASEGGATFEATSPSTGEVIGTVPQGTRGGRFSMERLTELKTIVVDLS